MKKVILQKEYIEVGNVLGEVGTEQDGAVAVFIGRPRNHSDDFRVEYLSYEIFESMARKELDKIADEVFSRWAVTDCLIVHRFGRVEIGEASIVIAVSSPHRDEAFKSARYIIDTVKKTVPIWKTEHYSDGTTRVFDRS
jgi:molybdopterin synthase catalytic subunit